MEKDKSFVKVSHHGNTFKSIAELARYLGVSRQAVHKAIKLNHKVKGHHVEKAD